MIAISESGMKFGPYEEMDIINWEKSSLYKSFGVGLKSPLYNPLDNGAFVYQPGI